MAFHSNLGADDSKQSRALSRDGRPAAHFFSKAEFSVFVLAIGLFIAFRAWQLTNFCVCSDDEYFSMSAIQQSWNGMMSSVFLDTVHPPLFYTLLKLWAGIRADSLLWIGLFPVVVSIAAIVPLWGLCRELRLRAADMNLALVLMAVNGYLVYYAYWLRMYSLLQFLALCSLWLFVRFFNDEVGQKKHVWALFATNLLLVYTHFYGWMVVGMEFVFLLFWRRPKLRIFSLSVVVLILCFTPWLYAMTEAARTREGGFRLNFHIGWIGRPKVSDLVRYYAFLDGIWDFLQYRYGYLLAVFPLLLFSYPIVLWVRHLKDDEKAEEGRATTFWLLALFAFLIPAVAFAISQFLPLSVWHDRHLIIAAVPYMLLVAMAVNRLRPSLIKAATRVLIVGWAILAGVNYSLQRGDHIAWDVLARQMSQAEPLKTNGIKVYVLGEQLGMFQALSLKFYLGWARERRFEVWVVKDMAVPAGNLFIWSEERGMPVVEVKDITALEGDHYWVAFVDRGCGEVEAQSHFSPFVWICAKQERSPQEILKDNGYLVGEVLRARTSYQPGWSPRFVSLTLFPVWRH
jgi:hypothetical protein